MINHPPQATIHILKKEIKMQTCTHLDHKSVEEDLVIYKFINEIGEKEYFGTCSWCYLVKISKKHEGNNKDD